MTEEEKSHDTPVLLDLTRGDRHPESLDVHIHTRHGWTVGNQLMDEFQEQGVEVRFAGYAQDVTHTAITIVEAAGGLAGAAFRGCGAPASTAVPTGLGQAGRQRIRRGPSRLETSWAAARGVGQ
jgi:hypothetical protein